MCECEEVSAEVKELRKIVKELSDAVGLQASTHFDALAALTARIKAIEDVLIANREVDVALNEIYNGSARMAKFAIWLAKVFGAITIIIGGASASWYALTHFKGS